MACAILTTEEPKDLFKSLVFENINYIRNFDSMTTLTVEIDKERDLPALQALLNRMGLKFRLADEDWGDLSETEIEGIKEGLEDAAAGRTLSHDEVMARINKKLYR